MVSARRTAIARRTKRLVGYWRSERRTLGQGLVALVLSTFASFVAGLTLGSITGTLDALPGLLVLIPASVGMRGTIFGAIGARLGTGIHAGLFEATLRRGGMLGRNVEVAIVSSLLSSFYLAAIAKLVAGAFGQDTIPFWDLVTISVAGGVLGSLVILVVTVALALLSFRRGWDLDAVSTPMVTAIGDMVTLPALFLATFLVRSEVLNEVASISSTLLTVAAFAWALVRSPAAVQRILVEMLPMIVLLPLLDVLAGALLEARRTALENVEVVLLVIPAFVSQAGALGGILSSRLSSKLTLGVITPRGRPEQPAVVDASIVMGSGLAIFTLIGTVGFLLSRLFGIPSPDPGTLIGAVLLAGVIALPVTIFAGYYIAVLTARFGLDPDNFGVPTITSLMDLVGVACVLFAMSLSGVFANG
jgi:mgtE-like transporter